MDWEKIIRKCLQEDAENNDDFIADSRDLSSVYIEGKFNLKKIIEGIREEDRKRVEEAIEKTMQEERFSGTPFALNKILDALKDIYK